MNEDKEFGYLTKYITEKFELTLLYFCLYILKNKIIFQLILIFFVKILLVCRHCTLAPCKVVFNFYLKWVGTTVNGYDGLGKLFALFEQTDNRFKLMDYNK